MCVTCNKDGFIKKWCQSNRESEEKKICILKNVVSDGSAIVKVVRQHFVIQRLTTTTTKAHFFSL